MNNAKHSEIRPKKMLNIAKYPLMNASRPYYTEGKCYFSTKNNIKNFSRYNWQIL